MESAWVDDSAHARFIRRLHRSRVDSILKSADWLQHLRFDWDQLTQTAKTFKNAFHERGINFVEYVIQNTTATPSKEKKGKKIKKLPVFDFGFSPLPAKEATCWSIWCPIQAAFGKHELFLPSDLFKVLTSFVPEPEDEVIEEPYDAEKANEWCLPMVKII